MQFVVTGHTADGRSHVDVSCELDPHDGATTLHRLDAAGASMPFPTAGQSPLPDHGGASLVVVTIPAGGAIGMHRTATVDYGVVVSGHAWLDTETGRPVLLQPGDVSVQCATRHSWRNTGTEPCILVFAMLSAGRAERQPAGRP